MSQTPDFFGADRDIPATIYWRYGRILALLGIWFQIGLLLNILWVTALWDDPKQGFVLVILIMAILKSLALFLYCRSRVPGDDSLWAWIASLLVDVVLFIILVPLNAREALDVTGVYGWLGLHYALAACLRWKSAWSYTSLVVPIGFLFTSFQLGNFPSPTGAITLFVLGLAFIVGTREAFVRDARRVEKAAQERRVRRMSYSALLGEYTSLVTGGLAQHAQVVTPLRRIQEGLQAAGESEGSNIAQELLLRVRELIGSQVGLREVPVGAMVEYAAALLAEDGIELEASAVEGSAPVSADTVQAFVDFLQEAGVRGEVVEILALVGRTLELGAAALNEESVTSWTESGWVKRAADPNTVLFYLDRG